MGVTVKENNVANKIQSVKWKNSKILSPDSQRQYKHSGIIKKFLAGLAKV